LKLLTVKDTDKVSDVYAMMKKYDVSQLPVVNAANEFIGSLSDSVLFDKLMEKPDLRDTEISHIMQAPFPMVKPDTSIAHVSKLINKNNQAVLMTDLGGNTHIITKYDIIDAVG